MADEVAVMSLAPLPFSLLHSATRVDAADPCFKIPMRLVETLISEPVVGQRQSYHAQPEGRLPSRTAGGRMSMRQSRRKSRRENIQEQVSHLCHTGGFVFLRLLEGMQGDAGPSGADVASLVENCPYSESFMPSVVPLSLHMLREQGGGQKGGRREDGL